MPLSTGSNLLSVALSALVFTTFVATLLHSYHLYAERRNEFECFGVALDLAEGVRDRATGGWPSSWLDGKSKTLGLEGMGFRVEVKDFAGKILLTHGGRPDAMGAYLSPPVAVGLPISLGGGISAKPCEMTVSVWRV